MEVILGERIYAFVYRDGFNRAFVDLAKVLLHLQVLFLRDTSWSSIAQNKSRNQGQHKTSKNDSCGSHGRYKIYIRLINFFTLYYMLREILSFIYSSCY